MNKEDLVKDIETAGSWPQNLVDIAVGKFMQSAAQIERRGSKRFPQTVTINGVEYIVDPQEVSYKFPRPAHYTYPQADDTGIAVGRIVRAFAKRRHVFIYGEAGCGKSAIVRALGHDFNRECAHYAMRESLDPELYLGRTVIEEVNGASVTRFEKGPLLLDLEGRIDKEGNRRPVVICFDDIDRAPAIYHEILRHVMDDNAKSIFVPELKTTVQVCEGTQIIATANSSGRGDATALYATSQVMDESILDRFNVVVHYPFMTEQEECQILQRRFPSLPRRIIEMCVRAGRYIRIGIGKGEIYGSFSHRRIVNWLQSIEDLATIRLETKRTRDGVMLEAAKDWLDWFDPQQRETIERALGPLLSDTEGTWK